MAVTRDAARLARCAVPTMMVSPVRDGLVDAALAARLVSAMPKGEARLWPDAAHEILREAEPLRSEALAALMAFAAARTAAADAA
jgi:lysophospholipase